MRFLRFFTRGILQLFLEVFSPAQILLIVHTTVIPHSVFSISSFSVFFHSEIYKSVLIRSFCSSLCSFLLSILSISLFFSTLLSAPCSVFSLSVYSLYFLISLLFSFHICYPFFSLLYEAGAARRDPACSRWDPGKAEITFSI